MSFEDFCAKFPSSSIALDGFVTGGPAFRPAGPYANFNHHEEVDRLATRATCAQVLMAIRQGLFNTFQNGSRMPYAHLYVNDCDEDVCVATFALTKPHLVLGTMNPIFNRLVAMEEIMDATAGAYPYPPDLPVLAGNKYYHLRAAVEELLEVAFFDDDMIGEDTQAALTVLGRLLHGQTEQVDDPS
jgi:hypothetical protein